MYNHKGPQLLLKEKTLLKCLLLFYWIVLSIATHIPVPGWVPAMGMSDKTMHYFAFFSLAVLVWAGFVFDKKVNWFKPKVWFFLGILLLYGILDEVTQSFIGRGANLYDLAADIIGAAGGFLVLTFLSVPAGLLVLINLAVFVLPYLAKAGILNIAAPLEFISYFLAFSALALSWIGYLKKTFDYCMAGWEIVLSSAAFSFFVLNGVMFYSNWNNGHFGGKLYLASLAGIVLATVLFVLRQGIKRKKPAD